MVASISAIEQVGQHRREEVALVQPQDVRSELAVLDPAPRPMDGAVADRHDAVADVALGVRAVVERPRQVGVEQGLADLLVAIEDDRRRGATPSSELGPSGGRRAGRRRPGPPGSPASDSPVAATSRSPRRPPRHLGVGTETPRAFVEVERSRGRSGRSRPSRCTGRDRSRRRYPTDHCRLSCQDDCTQSSIVDCTQQRRPRGDQTIGGSPSDARPASSRPAARSAPTLGSWIDGGGSTRIR